MRKPKASSAMGGIQNRMRAMRGEGTNAAAAYGTAAST